MLLQAGLLCALLLSSWWPGTEHAGAADSRPIRLAGVDYLGDLPTVIARNDGLFARHGLDVDVRFQSSGKGTNAEFAWWIGASLAGAALLFGLLTMIAFLLIHRRVAAPARVITRTLSAIRGGNPDARADVRGADELAELSRTLNQMLDERQLLDERLSEHNERLRQFHQLLDNSEDLCGIADGAYRYLWVNQTYRKSFGLEQHEIEKLTIPEVLGQDYFEQTLKPRIDRCLAGEAQRFETERYSPGLGARNLRAR